MDLSLTLDSRDEATIVKEDGPDGFSAETIFKSATGCQGLTYDDVILLPGETENKTIRNTDTRQEKTKTRPDDLDFVLCALGGQSLELYLSAASDRSLLEVFFLVLYSSLP